MQRAEWLLCGGPDDGTSVDTIPAGRHDAVDLRHGVPQHDLDVWTFNFFGAFNNLGVVRLQALDQLRIPVPQ